MDFFTLSLRFSLKLDQQNIINSLICIINLHLTDIHIT